MLPGFHGVDLIALLAIALLIFGPKKLPEMGSAIGKSVKEFRKGMSELAHPKEEPTSLPPTHSREVIELEGASQQAVTTQPPEISLTSSSRHS